MSLRAISRPARSTPAPPQRKDSIVLSSLLVPEQRVLNCLVLQTLVEPAILGAPASCRRGGRKREEDHAGRMPALVRLRESVHWRVKVPLWWSFPPRVESNCNPATGCGEQLETKRQSVELTGVVRPRHKLDTA